MKLVCFQKKPKVQEYFLGYFGHYRPIKGQGASNYQYWYLMIKKEKEKRFIVKNIKENI